MNTVSNGTSLTINNSYCISNFEGINGKSSGAFVQNNRGTINLDAVYFVNGNLTNENLNSNGTYIFNDSGTLNTLNNNIYGFSINDLNTNLNLITLSVTGFADTNIWVPKPSYLSGSTIYPSLKCFQYDYDIDMDNRYWGNYFLYTDTPYLIEEPRKVYLVWLGEVAKAIKKVLKDKGQLFLNMGYSRGANKKLMVCSGPGCKAWGSEKVLTLVRKSMNGNRSIQPCPVSCVNNCGGKVSVGLPSSGKIVKLREPSEVFALLSQSNRNG